MRTPLGDYGSSAPYVKEIAQFAVDDRDQTAGTIT